MLGKFIEKTAEAWKIAALSRKVCEILRSYYNLVVDPNCDDMFGLIVRYRKFDLYNEHELALLFLGENSRKFDLNDPAVKRSMARYVEVANAALMNGFVGKSVADDFSALILKRLGVDNTISTADHSITPFQVENRTSVPKDSLATSSSVRCNSCGKSYSPTETNYSCPNCRTFYDQKNTTGLPNIQSTGRAKEDIGKTIRCPRCGHVMNSCEVQMTAGCLTKCERCSQTINLT